jgi:glycosyltransferase involved in cell wall biosynthesis
MPAVSVIMASYNHAPYVRAAIESVLAQSFQDFEILVTDDGSTDGTTEIVHEIRDPRIHLRVLPRNSGACVAWNASISRATGDYIALLNSDDLFFPDKLLQQVSYLKQNRHVAAVFAYPEFIDERGNPISPARTYYGDVFFACNRSREAWLRRFFFAGNALCHPTSMVRRSCHRTVGVYNPALAQLHDMELYIRILRRYDIFVIEKPLVAFRILDNHGNASAPRTGTYLRSEWELATVLKNYRRLPISLLFRVFPELAGGSRKKVTPRWMSKLALSVLARRNPDLAFLVSDPLPLFWRLGTIALTVPRPAHAAFALDLMYNAARESGNPRLLREFIAVTETVDVYGLCARATEARNPVEGASH